MRNELLNLIPEFDLVKDLDLRDKCLETFTDALHLGGWKVADLSRMPFTLLIKPCPANMVEHIRANVLACEGLFRALKEVYGDRIPLNRDILIAGALLHDVGKLLEYEERNGQFSKSRNGKLLRHPISGTALAYHHGLPEEVQHIIAVHSKEGEGGYRTPEAIVLHHADFINFEPFHT